LEKQKRIDQFNAPESPLFAFLLSTRAGGVGINLATADTVIILDPDFNPHQDIQAISRAHRIGQKKKVLCFQLMTRASAEEKIVQMGRKKMALDHVVVEQLDAEDLEDKDVESILKHGAAELFKDDAEQDIRYDEASIEKLLDRSQIENTKTSADDSAESQFSFARVWANDQGGLQDSLEASEEEVAPDPGVWDKILKERQAIAAAEALAKAEALGRGKRSRMVFIWLNLRGISNIEQNVAYNTEKELDTSAEIADIGPDSPAKPVGRRKKKNAGGDSDTDFQAHSDQEDETDSEAERDADPENATDLVNRDGKSTRPSSMYKNGAGVSQLSSVPTSAVRFLVTTSPDYKQHDKSNGPVVKPFARVQLPVRSPIEPAFANYDSQICVACQQQHPLGACPLKVAGVEHCGLCGLAHYGHARTCPHIRSETQVRDMIEALKNSPEKKELVDLAMKYLRGVKGTLVQQKKRDREKAMQQTAMMNGPQTQHKGHAAPHQGPPQPFQRLPEREVPPVYQGPTYVQPGSVGSHLQQQGVQSAAQWMQPQHGQQHHFDDREVESALRGYLGR
jgi:hypothetical protein